MKLDYSKSAKTSSVSSRMKTLSIDARSAHKAEQEFTGASKVDSYKYQKTPLIKKYLHNLEVLRKVIDLLSQLPHIEENLRRKSLLKSSLYSARIEGNKLTLKDLQNSMDSKDHAQLEVANILRALHYLYSKKCPKKISVSLILKLHKLVMSGLSFQKGHFRKEPSAIFNQAGSVVYMPPPPSEVPHLIQQFINLINSSKEEGPLVASYSHFAFEKIHPFLDGNGRVGRLISTFILKNSGYSFRGLVSLEEYLEKNREEYYDLLASSKKDITVFIEYFLEGLSTQAEEVIESTNKIKEELPEDRLLPRRQEILAIIRDHKMVSFDFIKRRFRKIPDSTLHYDLKKLGTTKGVLYTFS